MTKTIFATAAILLASSVQAADSRQQFISGNPDSDHGIGSHQGMVAMPFNASGSLDRYQGLANRHPELFGIELGSSSKHNRPNIYGSLSANPDLSY